LDIFFNTGTKPPQGEGERPCFLYLTFTGKRKEKKGKVSKDPTNTPRGEKRCGILCFSIRRGEEEKSSGERKVNRERGPFDICLI